MKKNIIALSVVLVTAMLFTACFGSNTGTTVNEPVVANVAEQEPELREEDVSLDCEEQPVQEFERVPQNVTAVSAGPWHTLAVTESGTLWGWGGMAHPWTPVIIGDGTEEQRLTPVPIMENVVSASAGEYHSLAITSDNTLWAWGQNFVGQLGDGTTEDRLSPVPIMEGVIYATIAPTTANSSVMESQRSFAITEKGTLWGWGINRIGQLGDGTDEPRLAPVHILDNVVYIASNYYMSHWNGWIDFVNTFAVTACGALWAWGGGGMVEITIGDGTFENHRVPVLIIDSYR